MSSAQHPDASTKYTTKLENGSSDEDDEFRENLRNMLSRSETEQSYESDSPRENDISENTETEIQLIISALEKKSDSSINKNYNRTFTDPQLREIERRNTLLMKKILSHNQRKNQYGYATTLSKVTSSSINRKKRQQEIDQSNLVLLKRIQSIKPFGLSTRKK